MHESTTMRRMSARSAVAMLLAIVGMLALGGAWTSATADPGNGNGGANQSGPYDPHNVGQGDNQGNGNAPCNGCVGNADDKNPPGQQPGGNDHNKGYECDGNHGVGDNGGNPAHSGCTTTSTIGDSGCTQEPCDHHGCQGDCGGNPGCTTDCGSPTTLGQPESAPNAEVLGLTEEAPNAPAAAPAAAVEGAQELAFTGSTSDTLGYLGAALLAFGMAFVVATRKPRGITVR